MGYNGGMINTRNARMFCCEDIRLIENYDAASKDDTQVWDIHHRLEEDGETKRTKNELISQHLYYSRPAKELVFLTRLDHTNLHHNNKAKKHSDETRKRQSERQKGHWTGAANPNFGGMTEEHRRHLSESHKGIKWWNNGKVNVQARECPGPDFKRGKKKHEQ